MLYNKPLLSDKFSAVLQICRRALHYGALASGVLEFGRYRKSKVCLCGFEYTLGFGSNDGVTWPAKAGSGRPAAGRILDCSVEFRSSKCHCGSQV